MAEHPLKLPKFALNTVWGCPELSIGQRLVFFHDWDLDLHREKRCYASNEFLADTRLRGYMKAAQVGDARTRLKELGLHYYFRFDNLRSFCWVSILPPQFMGRDADHAMALALPLAAHLQDLKAWLKLQEEHPPDRAERPGKTRSPTRNKPSARPEINRVDGSGYEGGEGGETPRSSPTTESQLLASVGDPASEQGVIARAIEEPGGWKRRPGESTDDYLDRVAHRARRQA